MFKAIIISVLAFTAINAQAAETVVRQTRPDGTIDRAKPAWQVYKERNVTQLRSDGTPDRFKPRYRIQGNRAYELRRGGTVEQSKSIILQKEE
jgi:hypothetical protein